MTIITVKTGGIAADAVTDAKIADDIVGTEHLTANEVDTAALKGDAVTGAELADNAVNSEHYTDGSIDTVHLADGQVTIGKLATAVLTGATDIGAAIVDADLLLIDDGAGGTLRKTAASRLKTYIGAGTNTPNFSVTLASNQTGISTGTWTKLSFATEFFDSDSAFASNKFTIPSGKAGKYFFGYTTRITNIDDGESVAIKLYKNGSAADVERSMGQNFQSAANTGTNVSGFYMINASVDDYYEVYAYHTEGANQTAEAAASVFFGYKIIE